MSSTDSPAVARRRVRLALKAAREAKKFTQTQVANAMEWSLSKVIRIEKGEVNVAPSDLRVLLDFLEVSDPGQVQSLLDDARVSRQERWTVDAADREFLTPAMIELAQFEAESTAVRIYHNYSVPGRLQTRAYAEGVMRPYRQALGDEAAEARLAARQRRQELLFQPRSPMHLVLLDESVLMRTGGDVPVLLDQLTYLLKLTEKPTLRMRIVPLSSELNPLRFYGPFILCDLGDTRSAFMYLERDQSDEAVHDGMKIDSHRDAFEQAWISAPDESDSRGLIERAMARLRGDGS